MNYYKKTIIALVMILTVNLLHAENDIYFKLDFNNNLGETGEFKRKSPASFLDGKTAKIDEPVFVDGIYGKAFYSGSATLNLLSKESASAMPGKNGLQSLLNAKLTHKQSAEKFGFCQISTTNKLTSGIATRDVSIEPDKNGWYVASAYVKGNGGVLFYIEDQEHQITGDPKFITLSKKWQRVSSKILISTKSAKLKINCVSSSDKKIAFDVSRLQIEKSIDGCQGWASPWVQGNATRLADILKYTFPKDFPTKAGTLSFWFKPRWNTVRNNIRNNNQSHQFFYFSKSFNFDFYASVHPRSTIGRSLKHGRPVYCGYLWRWIDKHYQNFDTPNWHLWSVVWNKNSAVCYLDGKKFGPEVKNMTPFKESPEGKEFYIGAMNADSRGSADSAIDEFTIRRTAMTPADVWRQYSDGMKQLNINVTKRYFKPLPLSAGVLKRKAMWKKRGLKMDDVWMALVPSLSAESAYEFSLLGKIRDAGEKFVQTKANAIFLKSDSKLSRFNNIPGWESAYSSGNPAAILRSCIKGNHIFLKKHSSHTISAWIYLDDIYQPGGTIIGEGGSAYGFGLKLYHGSISNYITFNKVTASVNYKLTEESVNTWLNIVGVYDGKKDFISIYINGKKVAQKDKIAIPEMRIPGKPFNAASFTGALDEIVIWDKVLPPSRIEDLYIKGKPEQENITLSGSLKKNTASQATNNDIYIKENIDLNDIYLYASFDKTVSPDFSDTMEVISPTYVTVFPNKKRYISKVEEEMKTKGRFGKAVTVYRNKKEDSFEGLVYSMPNFPVKEGAISFWFRPKENECTGNLWSMQWVTWMSTIEKNSIVTWAGVSKKNKHNAIKGKRPTLLANTWYHYSATWNNKGNVEVYLNGEKIASGISPVKKSGYALGLGSIPQVTAIQRANLMKAGLARCLNADFDDFLITKKPLSAEFIKTLTTAEKPASSFFNGLAFSGIRTAFSMDEEIKVPILSQGSGSTVLEIKQNNKIITSRTIDKRINGDYVFKFAPYSFAPGKYIQILKKVVKDKIIRKLEREFIINDDYTPEIQMGFYGCAQYIPMPDFDTVVRKAHIRFAINGFIGKDMPKVLNRWFAHNICDIPALYYSGGQSLLKKGKKVNEFGILSPDGKWHSDLSPFSPLANQSKKEMISNAIKNSQGTPALRYLSFWDEYNLKPDVSPHSISAFKKKYNIKNKPDFVKIKPGTILEDRDPITLWVDFMGTGTWLNQRLARNDEEMTNYTHSIKPNIKTMSMPSSGFGGTSMMIAEVYPYITDSPAGRMWSKSDMITDSILEKYLSTVPQRDKFPLYILPGWLNYPSEKAADASLNIMNKIAIAKGAKGCIPAPSSWFWTRPDMRKSFIEFSDFCYLYSATLANLERNLPPKIGVYFNPLNALQNPKWWYRNLMEHSGFYQWLLPSMRLAGLNPQIVRDYEVKASGFKQYKVIFLYKTDIISRSVYNKIIAYIKNGGQVFIMPDSKIDIPGAIVVPFLGNHEITYGYKSFNRVPNEPWRTVDNPADWVPQIKTQIIAKLKNRKSTINLLADDSMLAMYRSEYADTEYVFVINVDRYNAHEGIITVNNIFPACYELTNRKKVAILSNNGKTLFSTGNLIPGAWRIFMLPKKMPEKIVCTASTKENDIFYDIALLDKHKKNITGAWPFTVSVVDSSGKTLYSHSIAMLQKNKKGVFHTAKLSENQKKLKVLIKDLITGITKQIKIK